MALVEYKVRRSSGQQIGVVHIPLYERWGSGNMFKRPPFAMTQDEAVVKRTVSVDSRGAHLIAAAHITSPGSKYYQWRQRVHVSNQNGALVDLANYLLPGGHLNHAAKKQEQNWVFDRQADKHEWYWSDASRKQAVYKNRVYWHTLGVSIDATIAEHFSLFEDTPNQPTQLLAKCGPFGVLPEIQKHPVSGVPLARELNKQLRIKFATALVETDDKLQATGGHPVLRFTWGFYMDYDGASTLYPLRRDDGE